jgi:hypothetical protein
MEGRVGSLVATDRRHGEETVGRGEETMWKKIGRHICCPNRYR